MSSLHDTALRRYEQVRYERSARSVGGAHRMRKVSRSVCGVPTGWDRLRLTPRRRSGDDRVMNRPAALITLISIAIEPMVG